MADLLSIYVCNLFVRFNNTVTTASFVALYMLIRLIV